VRRSAKEKTEAKRWPSSLRARSEVPAQVGEGDQLFDRSRPAILPRRWRRRASTSIGKIQLHEPLKTIGAVHCAIKLHKDVTTHLKVLVDKEAVRRVVLAVWGRATARPAGRGRPALHRAIILLLFPLQKTAPLFSGLSCGCRRQAFHESLPYCFFQGFDYRAGQQAAVVQDRINLPKSLFR